MDRLRRFLQLSPSERCLLLEAAFLLGVIRIGLWLLPIFTLHRLLTRVVGHSGARRRPGLSPHQVARAVAIASAFVPGSRTCLIQALATQALLEREGHLCNLWIGISKEVSGKFIAHAWVESEGQIVIGGTEVESFTPLLALPGRHL